MTGSNLAARNELVNWHVAPAEHQIANYDYFQEKYYREVQALINPLPMKSVKKKAFFTIAANVLCADMATSKDNIDPIDRDLYLPLEITLAKWNLGMSSQEMEDREVLTKTWFINPGEPTRNSRATALEHRQLHKIDFAYTEKNDAYVENDLNKVMKEINSFLGPDRTVYSIELKHCRQDIGSLKWLNIATGCKTKPIKVYSLEDLYAAVVRKLKPSAKEWWGRGMAKYRLDIDTGSLDQRLMCEYHASRVEDEEAFSSYCAQAVCLSKTHVILNIIKQALDSSPAPEEVAAPPERDASVGG